MEIEKKRNKEDNGSHIAIDYDGRVSIYTIIFFFITFASIVSTAVWIQSDVTRLKYDQEVNDRFRYEVRENYITRQQLDDVIIDRFDRFESNILFRMDRIEQKIDGRE